MFITPTKPSPVRSPIKGQTDSSGLLLFIVLTPILILIFSLIYKVRIFLWRNTMYYVSKEYSKMKGDLELCCIQVVFLMLFCRFHVITRPLLIIVVIISIWNRLSGQKFSRQKIKRSNILYLICISVDLETVNLYININPKIYLFRLLS